MSHTVMGIEFTTENLAARVQSLKYIPNVSKWAGMAN